MKSTLVIKDLALDKALDGKAMAAVHGGAFNQANATQQGNQLSMFAPVKVGNGSGFCGMSTIQVESTPTQDAYNDSRSYNEQSFGWAMPPYAY